MKESSNILIDYTTLSSLTITNNDNASCLKSNNSYLSTTTIVAASQIIAKDTTKNASYNEQYFNNEHNNNNKQKLKLIQFVQQFFINNVKPIPTSTHGKQYQHPKLLKHYGEIQNKKQNVGMGASATVKLIINSKTSMLYAVKVFKKKKSNELNSNYMKKLISEFCISSTLNHPNIIKTIDLVIDHKQRYCTIMEYCPGGDLYSYIKDYRISADESNGYFKQILNGLSYLHGIGVAHRDIKPENILLVKQKDNSIILKLTDFGEADVFREIWQENSRLSDGLCGSTPYIAPEIFLLSKKGYRASQSDVWSTAIVYFSMRINGVPFYSAQNSDSNYRLFKKHYQNQTYPAFQSFDGESKSMLYAMMNPDPEKRYTIQDVLKLTWLAEVQPPIYLSLK